MSLTRRTSRRVLPVVALLFCAVTAASPAEAQEDYVVLKTLGSAEGRTLIGLLKASDGNFYGMTEKETFRLTPAGVYTAINAFGSDNVRGDLIQGSDGHLYGASQRQIVRIALDGTVTVLHTLTFATDGAVVGSLVEGDDGNFYGVTRDNGTFGFGSVFRVTPAGVFTVLSSLTPAEGSPLFTHLIKGSDGYFYGNFQSGGGAGIGLGTIVRIDTSGTITVVHRFSGGLGGFSPESGLLQASDGNFYGTTWGGGASGNGTLYRLQPDGLFTIRHSFSAAGGEALRTFRMRLIEDAAGNLYGSADRGIFVLTPEGTVRLLHYVEIEAGKDRYGSFLSALTLGDDGNLYGTAGSSSSLDVSSRIFRLNTRRSPCANLVELRWTPEILYPLRITNVVKSETPAVWGTWFIFEDGTAVQLWMRNLPAITPTSLFYVPVRIPPSGTVSVVTVLVTASLDVCADVKSIDTGPGGADSAGERH